MNNTKSKDPLVIYIGRVKAYKQIDHLIKAFKIINKEIMNSKLIIAGSGDKSSLISLTSSLNLDLSVEFYDEVSQEIKLKLLHEAWVFVTTSMKEGWCITVIEANACGTPAIGYDVPGLRDSIKHGYNGLLVKDSDINTLAKTVIKVLNNKEYREELSENAIEWGERFSWDKSAEELEEVIEDVISENNGSIYHTSQAEANLRNKLNQLLGKYI